jgi:branched-chain amino acid transport system ATP-binding protein
VGHDGNGEGRGGQLDQGTGGLFGVRALRRDGGERRRLHLCRLLISAPNVLLLDEPAAGLGAQERGAMMALVRSVMASLTQQVTVLYTEHNMDAVFGVADRVLVLIDGELAAQGTPESIAQNALVRQRYLGQHFQVPPFAGVHHA